jgi:hypothetical protein
MKIFCSRATFMTRAILCGDSKTCFRQTQTAAMQHRPRVSTVRESTDCLKPRIVYS